jgi:dienelactone hydrolase
VYGRRTARFVLAHWRAGSTRELVEQARALAAEGPPRSRSSTSAATEVEGPGDADPLSAPLGHDVLAAVRWLKGDGAKHVSAVGASMGGGGVPEPPRSRPARSSAWCSSPPGRSAAPVAEAPGPQALHCRARRPRRNGACGSARIRDAFERTPEPKRLILLDGSAHAQFLFDTDQGDRLLREIEKFLTEP